MEATRSQLLQVREAATDRDKMDPGFARSIIESAHLAIEKNMLEAIPWPEKAPWEMRAPCYWHVCLRMLHDTRRRLKRPHCSASASKVIRPLNKIWRKAVYRTVALSHCRSYRKSTRSMPISLPNQFYSSPSMLPSNV